MMNTVFRSVLGFFLIAQCCSSPTNFTSNTAESRNIIEYTKNGTIERQDPETTKPEEKIGTIENIQSTSNNKPTININISNSTNNTEVKNEDVLIIDLDKINQMSPLEFAGRQIRHFWNYLIYGEKDKETSLLARCAHIAKKINQLLPLITIGGGVIITKLAFLVLFSLKTLGLLGLLLLLNVGTVAAKLGAYLASKNSHHPPQELHFHGGWKKDDHVHHSSHIEGPPYGLGWDDRNDVNLEGHELYNLYEKLRLEHDLKRYLSRG